MYFTYIISCENGELYTGITNDLKRRMSEHFGQTGKCAKFTRSHKAAEVKAVWSSDSRSLASKLEWCIKQLRRDKKLRLIDDDSLFAEFFPSLERESFIRTDTDTVLAEIS